MIKKRIGGMDDIELCIYSILIGLVIVLIFAVVYATISSNAKRNAIETAFNGGICPDCGGRYSFIQAVGHREKTGYIYVCDVCGNAVEYPKYVRLNDDTD